MGHAKRSKKTAIGCKRTEDAEPYRMKRVELRKVSKKQAKRTRVLQSKLVTLLQKQVELYGTCRCEQGWVKKRGDCFGELVLDHVIPRSRCPKGVDDFKNLQILCSGCNSAKGSGDTDYRDGRMIEACRMLDLSDTI